MNHVITKQLEGDSTISIFYRRDVPKSHRLLLKHETAYQEYSELCMIILNVYI